MTAPFVANATKIKNKLKERPVWALTSLSLLDLQRLLLAAHVPKNMFGLKVG